MTPERVSRRDLYLARQNLGLAQKGYELLDMKYRAMLHELKAAEKAANELRRGFEEVYQQAIHALSLAKMELSTDKVDELWAIISWNEERPEDKSPTLPYGLDGTSVQLDEAYLAWCLAMTRKRKLDALEATIAHLHIKSQKVRKRASALGNITIPTWEARIKYISEQLEERERDEMVRIKVAKERI